MQTWHLRDGRQSFVLASTGKTLPTIVYWGASLGPSENLEELVAAHQSDVTGGMLDVLPPLSISPESATGFAGQPGIEARTSEGIQIQPRFRFQHEVASTSDDLQLLYRDDANGLTLKLAFHLDEQTSVITANSELESQEDIVLNWLAAPAFPCPAHTDHMLEFSGRWCSEFQTEKLHFATGARERTNRTGRTDHTHFPGLIVLSGGTNNSSGEAFGFHYGWSGGHTMVAEEIADGRRQLQFGHAKGTQNKGRNFSSAPIYATFSPNGLNEIAVAFQRHTRKRIVANARSPRPVHYNCWEAVYFDHDISELKDIASRAASLGAERFVLDDGWFGRRDDDTSSLGDWQIDPRKYPDGLTPLISHVRSLGMEFGLWFEPEMVNENSDLFREHPDWILGPADQPRGRQQLVLDLRKQEVEDHLYKGISEILGTNQISYVKWDHNRVLPIADASQTEAVYSLFDRLREAFPLVEFESCASGGGRIDFGILQRTQRVWLSDSNDAIERQKIQRNAALFLPASVTGSHVGPRRCHTSGRTIDIRLRAWTAAQRHMGFEMDPRELTEEEANTLTQTTSWWKDNRDWMMSADILRLDTSDPAEIAELHRSASGDRFVVFSALLSPSDQIVPKPLRLTGLDADARYCVRLKNRADVVSLSRGDCALKTADLSLSGQYLMQHGLNLPWRFPESMWVVEGQRL
ncbi:alpha-galactosidase [Roseibium polysiphoniae]|uniref:alpha-galactosidase n=1 Tax=Roseibium polysiphoniae TaxID=2571221 RepID=UPI0032977635